MLWRVGSMRRGRNAAARTANCKGKRAALGIADHRHVVGAVVRVVRRRRATGRLRGAHIRKHIPVSRRYVRGFFHRKHIPAGALHRHGYSDMAGGAYGIQAVAVHAAWANAWHVDSRACAGKAGAASPLC